MKHNERGLNDKTIEAFGLGYAPNAWEATIAYFRKKGISEQKLLTVGLITERDSGGYYDRFRNRIMFPIRDARGRMCGFGARKLNPDDIPKFINSPQSPLFDKSSILYGLDRAKKEIRKRDQVVIVEGYLDVVALHQAGFINTVSPMGTALTKEHLLLLKKYSRRIVLALDPDAAGEKATLRGLQVARNVLDQESDPVFDARGLVGYESRLKADIRVSILPDGLDPDEIANRDAKEWEAIVKDARPVVIHVMETLAAEQDIQDPKAKSDIANQVLPLIEDVSDPIVRDAYRQRLARLLQIDERTLLQLAPTRKDRFVRARKRASEDQGGISEVQQPPALSSDLLEKYCLGVLLRHPEWLYKVDREMQKAGLSRLRVTDFQHTDYREIFSIFQDALEQDIIAPSDYIQKTLSDSMMETADKLLEQSEKLDPNENRVFEDLMRGLLELRSRQLHQEIEYIQFLLEESHQNGDKLPKQHLEKMMLHIQKKKLIDQAMHKYISREVQINKWK